jgi:hypothetical protein
MVINMINYSDWCKDNTGIFYQLNKKKPLPFVTVDKPVSSLDVQFLAENANKEMFIIDTDTMVDSLIIEYYDTWEKLTEFYKIVPVGVVSETTTTNTSNYSGKDQVALNNDENMYDISGNNSNSTDNTNVQSKNYSAYKNFVLSSNFYDIIKANIRNYIFINVY